MFSIFLRYYKAKGYDIGMSDIIEDESQQATELKAWGEQDKKYLHYDNVISVKQLDIERVMTGDTFRLNCE